MIIFVMETRRRLRYEAVGVGSDIMESVYLTLCSWFVETSQLSIIIKDKATVDAYGYVIVMPCGVCA